MADGGGADADVLVVGGGLHGLSAALQTARRGRRVVLLERSVVGRHASGASAAGVRTLGRHAGDLDLALESKRYWRDMPALVGDRCGYHEGGQLRVAETPAQMRSLEGKVRNLEARGYRHEVLVGPAEIRRIAPALRSDILGAVWVADDGAADPHRTLRAFRAAALAAGVAIRENEGVRAIDRRDGRWVVTARSGPVTARAVVNAAGAWAHQIAAMVGDRFEMGTKASMMMVTERVAPFIGPVVGAEGRPLSFKQTDRGTLLIGGGLQGGFSLEEERTEPDFTVLAQGARAACELFPAIGPLSITRVWSGLEAKTPDLLPVIDLSPQAPDFVHVFGFSGHGFQLVPGAGFAVADLILDGRTSRPIGAMKAGRFSAAAEGFEGVVAIATTGLVIPQVSPSPQLPDLRRVLRPSGPMAPVAAARRRRRKVGHSR